MDTKVFILKSAFLTRYWKVLFYKKKSEYFLFCFKGILMTLN